MKYQLLKQILIASIIFLLISCGTNETKMNFDTIYTDKQGYFDNEFSKENIPENIIESISAYKNQKETINKSIIKVNSDATYTNISSGNVSNFENESLYQYIGNGIFRVMEEESTNGFPSVVKFSMQYQGLIPLKEQTLFATRRIVTNFSAANTIEEINIDLSEENDGGSVKYIYGEYDTKTKKECKLLSIFSGSNLNKNILGDVKLFECSNVVRDLVVSTDKFAYLTTYQLPILIESKNSSGTSNFIIKDFIEVKP